MDGRMISDRTSAGKTYRTDGRRRFKKQQGSQGEDQKLDGLN